MPQGLFGSHPFPSKTCNGVRLSSMPGFGQKDQSDAEVTWQLVRFIRHLPRLTSEEREETERLNPKSEMERMENEQEQKFLHGDKPSGMNMPDRKDMHRDH